MKSLKLMLYPFCYGTIDDINWNKASVDVDNARLILHEDKNLYSKFININGYDKPIINTKKLIQKPYITISTDKDDIFVENKHYMEGYIVGDRELRYCFAEEFMKIDLRNLKCENSFLTEWNTAVIKMLWALPPKTPIILCWMKI